MSDHAERECEALFGSPYERIAELERELAAARKERDAISLSRDLERTCSESLREERAALAAVVDKLWRELCDCGGKQGDCEICRMTCNGRAILAAHDAAQDAEIVALRDTELRLSRAITTAIQAEKLQNGGVTYVAKHRADVESAGVMAFQQSKELIEEHDRTLVKPLVEACDPFHRVCDILDSLPVTHRISNAATLFDVLPTGWPTMGDLRKLRAALAPYKCRTCDGSGTVFDEPSAPCPVCTKEVADVAKD